MNALKPNKCIYGITVVRLVVKRKSIRRNNNNKNKNNFFSMIARFLQLLSIVRGRGGIWYYIHSLFV